MLQLRQELGRAGRVLYTASGHPRAWASAYSGLFALALVTLLALVTMVRGRTLLHCTGTYITGGCVSTQIKSVFCNRVGQGLAWASHGRGRFSVRGRREAATGYGQVGRKDQSNKRARPRSVLALLRPHPASSLRRDLLAWSQGKRMKVCDPMPGALSGRSQGPKPCRTQKGAGSQSRLQIADRS